MKQGLTFKKVSKTNYDIFVQEQNAQCNWCLVKIHSSGNSPMFVDEIGYPLINKIKAVHIMKTKKLSKSCATKSFQTASKCEATFPGHDPFGADITIGLKIHCPGGINDGANLAFGHVVIKDGKYAKDESAHK